MTPGPGDALLAIDVQGDFLPGGALAVPEGDAVIAPIRSLAPRFRTVVLTQDWHPAGHASFASTHPGHAPFGTVRLSYGEQVLWPDHCVQGSAGAALEVDPPGAALVLRKGLNRHVDSYSAFAEADGTKTGLAGYLHERGVARVFLCGLATDYCVAWSALDARAAGFETVIVTDAVRAIDQGGSLAQAWARMEAAGIGRIASADLA